MTDELLDSLLEKYREELEPQDLEELLGEDDYNQAVSERMVCLLGNYEMELENMDDEELFGEDHYNRMRENAIEKLVEGWQKAYWSDQ